MSTIIILIIIIIALGSYIQLRTRRQDTLASGSKLTWRLFPYSLLRPHHVHQPIYNTSHFTPIHHRFSRNLQLFITDFPTQERHASKQYFHTYSGVSLKTFSSAPIREENSFNIHIINLLIIFWICKECGPDH